MTGLRFLPRLSRQLQRKYKTCANNIFRGIFSEHPVYIYKTIYVYQIKLICWLDTFFIYKFKPLALYIKALSIYYTYSFFCKNYITITIKCITVFVNVYYKSYLVFLHTFFCFIILHAAALKLFKA